MVLSVLWQAGNNFYCIDTYFISIFVGARGSNY